MRTHLHHCSGRPGPSLPYFDASLVLEVTPADHRLLHLILDDLDLQWPQPGGSVLAHRVLRVAVTCGWLADAGRPLMLRPSAVRALQQLLLEAVAELVRHHREEVTGA